MVCKIVGVMAVEGTSKKTGRPFDAYILHTLRQVPNDDRLKGVEAKQLFVDKKFLLEDVKQLGSYGALVGKDINISFDQGGFVESVSMIPAE